MNIRSTQPTVCHVLLSLDIGGAEVLARQFAQSLQEQFRPVFACLDSQGTLGDALRRDGVPICVLGRRPGIDVRCAWRLRRWLKEQKVSLIHAHQYTPFFYSALARTATGRTPILFTEHGRHHPDHRSSRRVWANRLLTRSGDRIVAVSEHVREALIANEGFAPNRVSVIQNGVSEEVFHADAAVRCDVRRELGFGDNDEVVIQVARLNRLKDHATAIRAIGTLRSTRPNVRLLLAGDGELRRELESLVAELELGHFVRFLGTRNDVPRLLQAADVFLLSSISEGIPLTLVEAMLTGVPCVATRVGGVPEVIRDEVDGLLANAGDAAQLSDQLRRLLDDGAFRRRIARNGTERARSQFGAGAMISQYEHVYHEMLRTGPSIITQRNDKARVTLEPSAPASLQMSGSEAI